MAFKTGFKRYAIERENDDMKQGVLYARVSSREQEREGYSIPAQIKLSNDYAVKRGVKSSASL